MSRPGSELIVVSMMIYSSSGKVAERTVCEALYSVLAHGAVRKWPKESGTRFASLWAHTKRGAWRGYEKFIRTVTYWFLVLVMILLVMH